MHYAHKLLKVVCKKKLLMEKLYNLNQIKIACCKSFNYLFPSYDFLFFFRGQVDNSIFENRSSGLYGLRPGTSFHMYISTAPCGDARVFSPADEAKQQENDSHPFRYYK